MANIMKGFNTCAKATMMAVALSSAQNSGKGMYTSLSCNGNWGSMPMTGILNVEALSVRHKIKKQRLRRRSEIELENLIEGDKTKGEYKMLEDPIIQNQINKCISNHLGDFND